MAEEPQINGYDTFPCSCGHDQTLHYPPAEPGCEFGCCNGGFDGGGCDKCDCRSFREMDNLEFLEWRKRNSNIHANVDTSTTHGQIPS